MQVRQYKTRVLPAHDCGSKALFSGREGAEQAGKM
jgi:hypothetical protein